MWILLIAILVIWYLTSRNRGPTEGFWGGPEFRPDRDAVNSCPTRGCLDAAINRCHANCPQTVSHALQSPGAVANCRYQCAEFGDQTDLSQRWSIAQFGRTPDDDEVSDSLLA